MIVLSLLLKKLSPKRTASFFVQDKVSAHKKSNPLLNCFFAVRTGLEPATSAVTGRHSNQLNYRTRVVRYFSNAVQRYGNFSFLQ